MAGVFKSIQNVTITIAAGATSGTATINSVNTSYAGVQKSGEYGPVTAYNSATCEVGVSLTNATTVTATRNTSDASNAITVNCVVLEGDAATIKSVQQGTITLGSTVTSNTATITSVTTTNSITLFGGFTSTNSNNNLEISADVTLTNGTTVTATRGNGTNSTTLYYTIMEFNSGVLNSSTQKGQISLSSGSTSGTATITSVTTGQAMILWNGYTCTSANTSFNYFPYMVLTNGTTITATRTTGDSLAAGIRFCVVEFKSTDINSLQRSTIAIPNSTASQTATITGVVTARTIANWLGNTNDTVANTQFFAGMTTLSLTNTTTLTATRGGTGSASIETTSYEAVEFKAYSSGAGNMLMVF